jgi:hypothetical protein
MTSTKKIAPAIAAVNSMQKRESDTVHRKRTSIIPAGVCKIKFKRMVEKTCYLHAASYLWAVLDSGAASDIRKKEQNSERSPN